MPTRRCRRALAGLTVSLATAVVLPAGVLAPAAGAATRSSRVSIEAPPAGTLSETGSSTFFPLFNLWSAAYTTRFPDASVTTASTGSGAGITAATDGTADIGASDAYLSSSERAANPTLENIPLAVAAVLVVTNLPGIHQALHLSGSVLSGIYRGTITSWNAPALAALNPGVALPDLPIVAVHRSDGAGNNFVVTSYLTKADPTHWGATIGEGTTVAWPTPAGAAGAIGDSGVLALCKAQAGCVAFVGISYQTQALQDGLTPAELVNASGHPVAPTASGIAAEAASFARSTPADGVVSLVDGPAADGYPLVAYGYAVVNRQQSSAATARALRSFLEWALSPTGGDDPATLATVGFVPLPAAVAAGAERQVAAIR